LDTEQTVLVSQFVLCDPVLNDHIPTGPLIAMR
jgi:hypothetical protein